MTYQWVDCEPAFIAQRYDRIAGLIGLFDRLLFLPPQLRRRAAAGLRLNPGDRVLEIGCGAAVGATGKVYGVDLSSGTLRRARALCRLEQWENVELTQCDALEYIPCEPLDGIMFGLCYNTMPHHLDVLRHAWKHLRPGGRIVIMDGKLPRGRGANLALPFGLWLMKHTLLGNPLIKPWNDLAAIADEFEMEEFLFGSWYVCWGTKSAGAQSDDLLPAEQLLAAE